MGKQITVKNSLSSCPQVDNSENILKVLKKLWRDQSMCDIHLKVGSKEFGAHRFILCASSDVFQVRFKLAMRDEIRAIISQSFQIRPCL